MRKKITIGVGQLTNTIYAGTLIENGTVWGDNRQDVTTDCLVAVVEHGLKFGKAIQLRREDGTLEYEINVKKIHDTND